MTKRKPKKNSRKIKVHYDRLFAQLFLFLVVAFVSLWLISRCYNEDTVSISRKESLEAVNAAKKDVERVLNTAPGSMERDNALLYIRSREQKLRSNGYGHAADDYINTARSILNEHGVK